MHNSSSSFFLKLDFWKKEDDNKLHTHHCPFLCMSICCRANNNEHVHSSSSSFLTIFFATDNDNDELGTYCLPFFFICLSLYREDDDKHLAPHCPFVYYLCPITEKMMTSIVHRHLFIPLQKRWQQTPNLLSSSFLVQQDVNMWQHVKFLKNELKKIRSF